MIDLDRYEEVISQLQSNDQIVELVVRGTDYSSDGFTGPDDLGYSPEILRASQIAKTWIRENGLFVDHRDFGWLFLEVRRRIVGKCNRGQND